MPTHRLSRPRRAGAVGVAVLAATLALVVAPAGAATRSESAAAVSTAARPLASAAQERGWPGPRTPGDEPLPGYTISNPPLPPLSIDGELTRVKQGVRRHAAYDIEVPARWNGELLMWAHGYRGTGRELTVAPPGYGLRERLLRQGYAWAASSYARNDYDVATGVRTTHDLARYSRRVLGKKPRRTYVAGVSMGGHVIGRSLEQYPKFYDGALPMCGVMGDQELFDYFLSYNLLAQDLADREVYPPPADYLTSDVPVIQQRLGLTGLAPFAPLPDVRGRQLRSIITELSGGERPGSENAFAIWKDFLFTLYSPDNGGSLAQNAIRVAQNHTTVYAPDEPVDVNATVRRVRPTDPRSRASRRLIQVPRIAGTPRVPVLTLHGLGDLFVPFSMEQIYARDVARRRQSDLLVQRAIRSADHCEFTPREVGTAWDDLTDWVESKRGRRWHYDWQARGVQGRGGAHHDSGRPRYPERPAGDEVLDASTVASSTYGCRFTDPSGYASPEVFATRGLYERCPG